MITSPVNDYITFTSTQSSVGDGRPKCYGFRFCTEAVTSDFEDLYLIYICFKVEIEIKNLLFEATLLLAWGLIYKHGTSASTVLPNTVFGDYLKECSHRVVVF